MKIEETKIKGVYVLTPNVFEDERGCFFESFNNKNLIAEGLVYDFIQDNQSYNKYKGTLRGIHFQKDPYSQTKLVRVVKGSVIDVAVDLRKDSPSFKQWVGVKLSADNYKQLLIPKGFGHGFITLEDDTIFAYKVDNYYSGECDRSIRYDDTDISVNWDNEKPILSKKDISAPFLKDSDCDFK